MSSDATPLEVHVDSKDGAVIIRPVGDIELGCSSEFRSRLHDALPTVEDLLIVDLSDVPYMDSSGVATLVELMQLSRRGGSRLVLCNMHERVRSIFDIARLDSVFTIVGSIDDALTT
jgi:anti-sigma B factor antagonist